MLKEGGHRATVFSTNMSHQPHLYIREGVRKNTFLGLSPKQPTNPYDLGLELFNIIGPSSLNSPKIVKARLSQIVTQDFHPEEVLLYLETEKDPSSKCIIITSTFHLSQSILMREPRPPLLQI